MPADEFAPRIGESGDAAQRYSSLFMRLGDAVIVADRKSGAIVDCNAQAEALLLRRRDEIIGMHQTRLHPPGKEAEYRALFASGIRESSRPFEAEVVRSDGTTVAVAIVATLVSQGDTELQVGVFRDMSGLKRAEDELRFEHDRLKALMAGLAAAGIGIDVVGRDLRVRYQNSLLMERFGDLTGRLCHEGYMRSAQPCAECPAIEALARGAAVCRLVAGADGRDYEILSAPLPDSSGSDQTAMEIVRDVTEQKRAEEAMRQSEERFRALFERAPLAYQSLDEDGRFLDVNEAWLKTLGYDRDEVIGKWFGDFLVPEHRVKFNERFPRFKATGAAHSEFEMFHKSGLRRHIVFEGRIAYKSDGSFERTHCILSDETERTRAEEALRQSEQRLRSMTANISDVIGIMGADGVITFKSPNITKWFGWQPEDLVGFDGWQTVHPDDVVCLQQRFGALLAAKPQTTETVEYRLKCKDGTYRWIELTATHMLHDPAIGGVLLNYHDITERKRAEAERAALEGQLRQSQKMEAIGTLAGGIAHDFNNLLTGILGYSMLLKQDAEPGTRIYDGCDVIEKSATRAAELTQQLLGFARKGKLRDAPVDMHRVIASTVAILGRTIDKRVAVTQRLAAQTAVVKGDISQLEQVVMNLAINAGEAMPRGGDLVLKTEVVDLDEEYCRHHPELSPGTYLIMSVSDTGTGIRDEDLPRIFEPFFTTKDVGKGTGLGLAMVYGIVKNHGGNVTVETALGSGTTFKVYLPCEGPHSAKPDSGEYKALKPGAGKILVVDDEEGVRHVMSAILTPLGYDVETACSGKDAVEYCSERIAEIDLVILDLTMPVMDGRECFYALKELDPDVKVIIATGHALDSTGQELLDAGALRFLRKPFRPDQLAEAVAKALSG